MAEDAGEDLEPSQVAAVAETIEVDGVAAVSVDRFIAQGCRGEVPFERPEAIVTVTMGGLDG